MRIPVLSPCFDALSGNPLIEVGVQEPDAGACKFHEGNTTFLHETPNEPLRAAETIRGGSNV
jgi:hypothetical protein